MCLKITNGDKFYFIACCYIAHIGSTFYNSFGADPQDPFEDLGIVICYFSTQGRVIIMGDMNARIGNVQTQIITWNELDKNEEVDITWAWKRISQDDTTNMHGRALCKLMHGMHLMALSRMHLFPHTHTSIRVIQQTTTDIMW